MVPNFIGDWQIGLKRFKETNPHFPDFDGLGQPVFAGWIFNGFDTARKRRSDSEIKAGAPVKDKIMVQADKTMHDRIVKAINDDLVANLRQKIVGFSGVVAKPTIDFRIGDIEDANVLIQNSLWLSVPLAELDKHEQVVSLQDKRRWAENQKEQIGLLRTKIGEAANNVIKLCA
jgi:hypothetical protein